jgi:hypothetical protein
MLPTTSVSNSHQRGSRSLPLLVGSAPNPGSAALHLGRFYPRRGRAPVDVTRRDAVVMDGVTHVLIPHRP